MPGARFSQADRVALRTVEQEDAPFLKAHANDPAIRVPLTFTGPTTLAEQEEYIEEDDDGAAFLVTVAGEETGYNDEYVVDSEPPVEPIGFLTLFHVDEAAGSANIAYWITPSAQQQGYMSEAAPLLLDYAFGQRRLHRVVARALENNTASQQLLESLGFTREGTERDAKFVEGDHRDVARYSLLAPEWRVSDTQSS
ncbi:GNAT family N-acetyltransferase [Halodesulfurarchaeum sp.]|uniref:GNAT family N-acetyltransferase n=1 Tax=Halodesulfurarchaeum sp. TaxID=1980530 RepID=UPI002FC2AEE0